ncbi:MAG: hypothetical protein LBN10_01715 [Propionibacteriaceae bacterium]|nr:hypothetical protein [Propionibacteriaceae bacterium]
MKKTLIKRTLMTIVGVSLVSVAVALLRLSDLGTDPYTVLVMGLAHAFDSTYFVIFTIVSVALLVGALIFARNLLGFGTVCVLLLIGAIADQVFNVLVNVFPDPTVLTRSLLLIGGIAVMCLGSSLYYTADLGVSPYDCVALRLSRKHPKRFKYIRITADLTCTGIGFVLGGTVGVGTVVTAFFMGPLIAWMNEHIAKPLLKEKASAD